MPCELLPADVTVPKLGVGPGLLGVDSQKWAPGAPILKVTLSPRRSVCCLDSPKPTMTADKPLELP